MTPEQALKILEDVTSEITMSRKNHMAVLQALQVLNKLVNSASQTVSQDDTKTT
jgi:hypothetical protein